LARADSMILRIDMPIPTYYEEQPELE